MNRYRGVWRIALCLVIWAVVPALLSIRVALDAPPTPISIASDVVRWVAVLTVTAAIGVLVLRGAYRGRTLLLVAVVCAYLGGVLNRITPLIGPDVAAPLSVPAAIVFILGIDVTAGSREAWLSFAVLVVVPCVIALGVTAALVRGSRSRERLPVGLPL